MATPNPPEHATALERIRRLCNANVAAIWLHQGLVHKLIGPHADEVAMSAAFGIPATLLVFVAVYVPRFLICTKSGCHERGIQVLSAVALLALRDPPLRP